MLCKTFSLLALSVSTVVAKPYLHARFHHSGLHETGIRGTGHAHGTGSRNSTMGAATDTAGLPMYTVTVSALPDSDFTDTATTTDAATESTSTMFVTSTNHVTVTLSAVSSVTDAVVASSSTPDSSIASSSTVVLVAAQNVQPASRSSTTFATSAYTTSVAASVSTVSSSTAATTTASNSGSSGAKKGTSFNTLSYLNSFSGTGWTYNWGLSPQNSGQTGLSGSSFVPAGVEYVPMCWGLSNAPDCYKLRTIDAKAILSFNEPDNSGQSHMSVADAVTNHIKYIAGPFSGQVRIGSPAVTNSGSSGEGLDWMSQFLASCAGNCKVDFLAIHWYANSLADFQQHVTDATALGAKYGITKIWITEFALNGTPAEQAAFVSQALPWLESQSAVERYAYFWAAPFDNQYGMFSGSTLNQIGQAYNG